MPRPNRAVEFILRTENKGVSNIEVRIDLCYQQNLYVGLLHESTIRVGFCLKEVSLYICCLSGS